MYNVFCKKRAILMKFIKLKQAIQREFIIEKIHVKAQKDNFIKDF